MDVFFQIVTMAGGLALFLFGMHMLSAGLEKFSGGRLERILEKLTSNVFKGVLLGAVVTAAIQSSSATTVIVVGLVNAGILKLRSAIGIIMGANIGTTVTGQILRLAELDASGSASTLIQMIKPNFWAPLIAIVGVVMMMATKRKKTKIVAEILIGFGVLFQGMFIMTDAVKPLSDSPMFHDMFQTLGNNPLLGVLVGALVTAIIQSSSASVGILQAVASTGAVTYSAAFPIIMGQNIGTCVTSLLSSIGTSKNAKRAAMVHLYFNIIGTIVFLVAVYTINAFWPFSFWSEAIGMGGIANVHTLFNVVVTILFLPFTRLLEKLAILTIRGKALDEDEKDIAAELGMLDDRFLVSPSLALDQCKEVVVTMGEYAQTNFRKSINLLTKYDVKKADKIYSMEDSIDKMEDHLNNYILKLADRELTEAENRTMTNTLRMISEFERIGDYTINIVECAEALTEKEAKVSNKAMEELKTLHAAVQEIVNMALTSYRNNDLAMAIHIEPLEETIDMIQDALKTKHIERLKKGKCTIDGGLVFLDVLTNLERISDHCSNIAVYLIGYQQGSEMINRHEYIKRMHEGDFNDYTYYMEEYKKRYFDPILTKGKA
ncbi:Na/Pi cotransporter family protein [Massiliimalia massiliensis]|uniref:Na/Pi cotransporter family protein n=1 Tax=Massiliimalia massiliensis TaxID=1852384 RepID=UPI000987C068|nr:Na/Pi cotransporter family protein [Massiliimalia massiliensis]